LIKIVYSNVNLTADPQGNTLKTMDLRSTVDLVSGGLVHVSTFFLRVRKAKHV